MGGARGSGRRWVELEGQVGGARGSGRDVGGARGSGRIESSLNNDLSIRLDRERTR